MNNTTPSASFIVDKLLDTPPKFELDDPIEQIKQATRSPFTAWHRALEVGHRPYLWRAVKGSVYEPLYRERFKNELKND